MKYSRQQCLNPSFEDTGQEGEQHGDDGGLDSAGRTLGTVGDWVWCQIHPVNVFALNNGVPENERDA